MTTVFSPIPSVFLTVWTWHLSHWEMGSFHLPLDLDEIDPLVIKWLQRIWCCLGQKVEAASSLFLEALHYNSSCHVNSLSCLLWRHHAVRKIELALTERPHKERLNEKKKKESLNEWVRSGDTYIHGILLSYKNGCIESVLMRWMNMSLLYRVK